jgi:hypothetical protein
MNNCSIGTLFILAFALYFLVCNIWLFGKTRKIYKEATEFLESLALFRSDKNEDENASTKNE